MARRKVVDDPATPEDESAADTTVYDSDGDEVTAETHVCIHGVYVKHDHASDPRPYRLNHGGQNVEHVDTDALGVWHYRHM